MKKIAEELNQFVIDYSTMLKNISDDDFRNKPNPVKWSKIEILGHLVDSALSNQRRFVVAQYEESPHIVYMQDYWVTASGYQQYDKDELIQLWALINKHIYHVLSNMPEHLWNRTCMTQQLHTIEWLAVDYIKHLKHHMHVILELEPVAYP
jgi:hypothetical protein